MNGRAAGDAFTALGDDNRRAIVSLLHERDRSVQELADALPISRPAVSRHLRLLKDAGLVSDRTDGSRHIYRLDEAGVAQMVSYLDEMWGQAAVRFRLVAENTAESTPPVGDGR